MERDLSLFSPPLRPAASPSLSLPPPSPTNKTPLTHRNRYTGPYSFAHFVRSRWMVLSRIASARPSTPYEGPGRWARARERRPTSAKKLGVFLCFLCGRGCVGGGVREKKRRGEWVVEGSRQRRPGGPSSSERAEGAARSPLAAHWVGPSPSNQCRARPRLAGGIPGLRLGAEGGECGALVSGKGPGGGRRARGLSRVRALPDSLSRAARARKKSECEQKHAFRLAGPGGHVSSHPRPMGSPPRPQASAGAAVAEGGHRRRQPPAPAP